MAVTDARSMLAEGRGHLVAARTTVCAAMLAAEASDDFEAWATASSTRNAIHGAIEAIDRLSPLEEAPGD